MLIRRNRLIPPEECRRQYSALGLERAPRTMGMGMGVELSNDSPSPWTPAAFGADLWGYGTPASLVNDAGVSGTWTDLSGNGNSPTSAAAARPVYNATGNPAGGPCAAFDGVAHYMRRTVALADPLHVLLAVRCKGGGAAANETILDGGAIGGIGYNTIRTICVDGGAIKTYSGAWGAEKAYTLNTWTIIDVVWQTGANAQKLGLLGGAQATGTFGALTDPGGITLGGAGTTPVGEFANCDLAAWLVVKREMTAAERAAAVAWMRGLTGI